MKIMLLTPPQNLSRNIGRNISSPKKAPKLNRGLLPPLGIGYIASALIQNGYEVKIIDSPVYNYTYDDVVDKCKEFYPYLIGISVMTPLAKSAYTLAKMLKKQLPRVLVAIGGAHPTCYPEQTFEEIGEEIDAVVLGEGEYVTLEMVKRLESGKSFEGINGTWYRNTNGKIIKNPPNNNWIDLETLPFPARKLYPILSYAPEPYENKRLPATNILASRGCTWARCTFCERSGMLKRKYRYNSPEKTIEEMKLLIKDYKIKEFVFYDDDLLSNKRWVNKFCELLLKEKLNIIWSARALTQNITFELLKKAKAAGLWAILFGFESGDQELLDRIEKGNTISQSIDASRWCHELDIEIIGSFILGLPGETPEKGVKTIEFAKKLDCDYAAFIPCHPFVGTELYNQCLEEGKIILDIYDEKMEGTRFIPKISYVPDGYDSPEQIEMLIWKAYKEFYLRPSYIWKHIKKLRTIGDLRRYLSGFTFLFKLLNHRG